MQIFFLNFHSYFWNWMLNLMRKIQNIQKSSLFKFSRSILDNLTASIKHALREIKLQRWISMKHSGRFYTILSINTSPGFAKSVKSEKNSIKSATVLHWHSSLQHRLSQCVCIRCCQVIRVWSWKLEKWRLLDILDLAHQIQHSILKVWIQIFWA